MLSYLEVALPGRPIDGFRRTALTALLMEKRHDVKVARTRGTIHRRGSAGQSWHIRCQPLHDVKVAVGGRAIDRSSRCAFGAVFV